MLPVSYHILVLQRFYYFPVKAGTFTDEIQVKAFNFKPARRLSLGLTAALSQAFGNTFLNTFFNASLLYYVAEITHDGYLLFQFLRHRQVELLF